MTYMEAWKMMAPLLVPLDTEEKADAYLKLFDAVKMASEKEET